MASFTWRAVPSVPSNSTVSSVSVMKNGTLLGTSPGGQLMTKKNVASWVPVVAAVPPYVSMRMVSVAGNGFIGIGTNQLIYTLDTLYGTWQQFQGSTKFVDVIQLQNGTFLRRATQLADQTLLGVGTDNQIWTCPAAGQTWTRQKGTGPMLTAIQLFDGTFLGVDTSDQLATSTGLGASWVQVPNPNELSLYAVAQMPDASFVVVTNTGLLYHSAALPTSWTQVQSNESFLCAVQIDNGGEETFVGLQTDHSLVSASTLGGRGAR